MGHHKKSRSEKEYQAHNSWLSSGKRGQTTTAAIKTKKLFPPEWTNRSFHRSPLNKTKCWEPRNVVHFIIFSGSPWIAQGKLQCCLSGGKEPERCEGSAWQEGLVPPWQVEECPLCVPAGDIFPSLVCTWISCALPRFCRASVDCLLILPFCHLANLTRLSLAKGEILMFCLNLEVTFSSGFVIRPNELLQCNLFYFLFMEFDLNFSTDEEDVLTG